MTGSAQAVAVRRSFPSFSAFTAYVWPSALSNTPLRTVFWCRRFCPGCVRCRGVGWTPPLSARASSASRVTVCRPGQRAAPLCSRQIPSFEALWNVVGHRLALCASLTCYISGRLQDPGLTVKTVVRRRCRLKVRPAGKVLSGSRASEGRQADNPLLGTAASASRVTAFRELGALKTLRSDLLPSAPRSCSGRFT
jgi:hypothetical protein